jgi:hypothetical protein
MERYPSSWIKRLTIVRVSGVPNLSYRFNAIPEKIAPSCSVGVNNLRLKFLWRGKYPTQHEEQLRSVTTLLSALPVLTVGCSDQYSGVGDRQIHQSDK